jgi:hypothetical protein
MPKLNMGSSAVSHETRMPESTTQPMAAFSHGPWFDTTPKDPMMDGGMGPQPMGPTSITETPYGPAYGVSTDKE